MTTAVPLPEDISAETRARVAELGLLDQWRIRAQVDAIRRRRRGWLGGFRLECLLEDIDERRRGELFGTFAQLLRSDQ